MYIYISILLIPALLGISSQAVSAQVIRSQASGFWDDPGTWQGGVIPSSSNSNSIQIVAPHRVTLRDTRSVDEMIVSEHASLTVDPSSIMKIANGPGQDLVLEGQAYVYGVVEGGDGTSVVSTAERLMFYNGSNYRHMHRVSEGAIPEATWERESTLDVVGYETVSAASAAGNWDQNFGHLVWNCLQQTSSFNCQGMLDRVQGSLKIVSTGTGLLTFSSEGTDSLWIGGDFRVSGTARIELVNSASGVFTVNVNGNILLQDSGYLSMATNGRGRISVGGDLFISGGTITESGPAYGDFLFDRACVHRIDRGNTGLAGTITGRINYSVAASDTLDLGIAVLSAGIGNSNANSFQLGGTLLIRSTDPTGAFQKNTLGGSVRTAVSYRTFLPGSRLIYTSEAVQVLSDGAIGKGTTTIVDNAAGIQIKDNIVMEGDLILKRGALSVAANKSLTLSGMVYSQGGFLEGTSSSHLIISDSTSVPVELPFGPSVSWGSFTVDRRFAEASLVLRSSMQIAGELNLLHGKLINTNGLLGLSHGAKFTRWPGGELVGERIRNSPGETYTVVYRSASKSTGPFVKLQTGQELPAPENEGSLSGIDLRMAQPSDTVALQQNVVIEDRLDLNRGRLYVRHYTLRFKGTEWSDDSGNFGYGQGTVVFCGNTVVKGSSNPSFYHVRVLPECSLSLLKNTTIFGDIDFQRGSRIQADAITLTLSGGDSQQVSCAGAAIGNITVTKPGPSHIKLLSPLSLRGVLRFNSPSKNIDFKSDGFLTLHSLSDTASAFGQAMIYRLLDGNTVSGDVTVQRYMSGEGRIYRYISSPVSNATVASWKDDFVITGHFADPSPAVTICGSRINPESPSFFFYDERLASGYVPYPFAGAWSKNSPLEAGRGYAAFIRQCLAPTLLGVTGPINQQQVNLPVTFTATSSPFQGWNLVGNPYPCTIDWDLTGWTKSRISATIAIRDNGDGGFFKYWDGDQEPAGIVEGRIAPGQAFWVRATAPAPVLAVREGVKVTQNTEFFRGQNKKKVVSTIALSLEHDSFVDWTFIKVRAGGMVQQDSLDAPKLDNASFDLGTLSQDSVLMAINVIDSIPCEQAWRVVVKDAPPGVYKLGIKVGGAFKNYVFVLTDAFLQKQILVDSTGYTFTISVLPGSYLSRFSLAWRPRLPEVKLLEKDYRLCDAETVEIQLENKASDMRYEVWQNDRKISDSLTLIASGIDEGNHTVRVKATGPCTSLVLPGKALVRRLSPSIMETQGDTICQEGRATLTATGNDLNSKVRWYDSAGDTVMSGQGRESVYRTDVITQSTIYYVTASFQGECESKPVPVLAQVISLKPVEISLAGDHRLCSSVPLANQWFFEDQEIPGANAQFLEVIWSGKYTVENCLEGCPTRGDYHFTRANKVIILYPNPLKDEMIIETDFADVRNASIINLQGKQIVELDVQPLRSKKMGIFEMGYLKPGLYYLRVTGTDGSHTILGFAKK